MRNLLADYPEIPRGQTSRNYDIESGTRSQMNHAELGLEGFFKQVQAVEKQIDKLSKLLKKLQSANEDSKVVTIAATLREIKQQMEKDIDEVSKIARLAKAMLEELDRDNVANRQKPGCGKGSSVDRSRTPATISLKKKLKERMDDFQSLREAIQQECREVVRRRVFTVTGAHADEETIDRLIETGKSEQFFKDSIQVQGRSQVMNILAEVLEHHDTVRELERKLLELQQIFLDMAVLVEAQGDMLDNIESHFSSAADHVQAGTAALQKVKKLRKISRKCMCIAIIILLIIVAIIVMAVIEQWSNKGAEER